MGETPACLNCGKTLDRIDRICTERFILDSDVFRELAIPDGDASGEAYGVASDIELHCGYCGVKLEPPAREFFYRRWGELKRFMDDNGLVSRDPAGI